VKTQDYLTIWAESTAELLQTILGTPFKVEMEEGDDPGVVKPAADAGVWLEFLAGPPVSVKQAFWISPSDGAYLARSFVGEEPDPLADLTDENRDAIAELVRQIAGNVALALKAKLGKECAVQFVAAATPQWTPAVRNRLRLIGDGRPPLTLHIQLETPLTEAPAPPPEAPAMRAPIPPAAPAEMPAALPTAAGSTEQRNLDLLLEMELEVAIRFGRREMLLRDILELNAGAVVEFEQHIEDPVDLLLGGRVIGRGEVVVVDGNYGLRVSEISGTHARLNSLVK
jgi:flagellar motor switch protein FliN/FliY